MDEPWTLTARWIFPVDGPPLPNGTVTVAGERIVAVQSAGERTADLDLGNAAVLPGLVNAHTHLDLSGLRGLSPPTPDFTVWLRQVIAYRRSRSSEQVQDDIRSGLAEALGFGTTLVGDISGDGGAWDLLAAAPIRAVVFREFLGLPKSRASTSWERLDDWLARHSDTATCRRGVSPHAPYSVRASLFFAASTSGVPAAVHLAESAGEHELLMLRRGPFVSFLQELGVWAPDGLAQDFAQILRLFSGASPALFVHCNYLPADAPVPRNGSIVYCPRTHAAFGHSPHPFRDFLARGLRVALGTDSLASNPDLSVLGELRFLQQRFPDVPGRVLLRMATLSGAEALGWGDETGSLTPGKSADLAVLSLPDEDQANPHDLVLCSAAPVRAVLCRGRWIHGNPRP
jgi:cytosine/adenosine deaminase-related metal-dependent hydrolase